MSDDVQRYMMYYDDLVPDDKGTWIRLEDYESLRAELNEAADATGIAGVDEPMTLVLHPPALAFEGPGFHCNDYPKGDRHE